MARRSIAKPEELPAEPVEALQVIQERIRQEQPAPVKDKYLKRQTYRVGEARINRIKRAARKWRVDIQDLVCQALDYALDDLDKKKWQPTGGDDSD